MDRQLALLGLAALLAPRIATAQVAPRDSCVPVVASRTPVSRGLPESYYDQGRASIAAIYPRHRYLAERRTGEIGGLTYSLLAFQPAPDEPVSLSAVAVDFDAPRRAWDILAKCPVERWSAGLLEMLEALSRIAAPPPDTARSIGEWSPIVDGLRGRLLATATEVGGRRQLQLDLELESLRNQVEIRWGSLSGMLDLTVEDEAGRQPPGLSMAGNEIDPSPYWFPLPYASSIRITLTKTAYEYAAPLGRTLLRPLLFQGWDLTSNQEPALYLRGTLTPYSSMETGRRAWVGPLLLPRVLLP